MMLRAIKRRRVILMNALEVKNLKVVFPTEAGMIRAVEGIDIEIEQGKCAAIVGESGCGKSV